jgi:hypothetical protein
MEYMARYLYISILLLYWCSFILHSCEMLVGFHATCHRVRRCISVQIFATLRVLYSRRVSNGTFISVASIRLHLSMPKLKLPSSRETQYARKLLDSVIR